MKTPDESTGNILKGTTDSYILVADLYRRYKTFVSKIIYRRLKNREDSEDAIQEVFLKLLKYLPDSIPREEPILKSYLYRTANSVLMSQYKKKKKNAKETSYDEVTEFLDTLEQNTFTQPDVSLEQREAKGEIMDHISKLHKTHRNLISLFYYKEVPYNDIALINKMSMGTVKSQLFRARQSLKQRLESVVSQ